MKYFIAIVVMCLLFVLQLAISDLGFSFGAPNLLLVYLAVLLLYWRLNNVLLLAVVAGFFLDFFSGYPDGVMVIGVVGGIGIGYFFGQMMFTEKYGNFLGLFFVIFSTVAFFFIVMILNELFRYFGITGQLNWTNMLVYKLGSDLILNLLFLYPIYWVYDIQMRVQRYYIKTNESV
jgi:cell shape-determining protein MreD